MRSGISAVIAAIFLVFPVYSRQQEALCGATRETWKEQLHLHRQARSARLASGLRSQSAAAAQAPAASRDAGNIVIMDDADGVVARRNEFNLDQKTVRFLPVAAAAARYRFETTAAGFDAAAAAAGAPLSGLGDDDSRAFDLPFSFPFFGRNHRRIFVNSDGNLTFDRGDASSSERSVGRLASGPPRIAGLFEDLDPSRAPGGVRVLAEAARFVVTWQQVPEYQDLGAGRPQTFQLRLYPDGLVELAYQGVLTGGAVVGISPGGLQGSSAIVSFAAGSSAEYSSTVAERFGGALEVDVITAAQKFFETHDDAYDYLVILNNQDIPAASGAVAYELTVRNFRSGYGDRLIDIGREFGSRSRLQSVINLGQLSQYPRDPNAPVPKRLTSRDTPLTVVGHEVGHLFLAYASVRDVGGRARPMLGVQDAHWAFTFNSEASLLEGNRIQDSGDGVSPRFSTTATVQGFSPLDQYLMGLRAPEKVPPTFFVAEASVSALRGPQAGVSFDGRRVDVTVQDLIAAVGRRTPDHTIAQRSFRLAFILVVRQGSEPSAADLEQVDTYRREFENFFAAATGGRATADTSLRRGLRLSSFPAAGVVEGRSAAATVSIDRPASAPLTVLLRARNGLASVPASVTIPAGALSAAFDIAGLRAGVEELAAEVDSAYEIALARIQVAAPASLRLVTVSGDRQVATPGAPLSQPIVLRVTGANDLRYPGAQVRALPSSGSVVPELAVADSSGLVSFRWTPGTGSNLQLQVRVEGPPSGEAAVISARSSQLALSQAVNAASFAGRIAPGGLATIRGTNLAPDGTGIARLPWPSALNGVQVLLNGRAAPLLYVSESQINFLLPEDTPVGQAEIVVAHSAGRSTSLAIQVAPFAPAIFFDPGSGFGAVLVSGSSAITSQRPARRGEFLEIYCTGLGGLRDNAGLMETVAAPEVSISGAPARVVFSGLTPGVPGLYQVNAQVPDQAAPGVQKLVLTIGGILSNEVNVAIE